MNTFDTSKADIPLTTTITQDHVSGDIEVKMSRKPNDSEQGLKESIKDYGTWNMNRQVWNINRNNADCLDAQ